MLLTPWAGLAVDIDAHLSKWWDRADTYFAHRRYKSEIEMGTNWHSVWLNRFCNDGRCNGTTYTEYGIGAGLLGEVLLTEYQAKHYAGIDISKKSRDASLQRLQRLSISRSRFSLHDVHVPLDQLGSRIFVTQAVMQHFPSLNYTQAFLRRVNECGAEFLMLQPRDGTSDSTKEVIPRLSHPGGWVQKAVQMASLLSTEELTRNLDRYILEWAVTSKHDNKFHSFRKRRG